MAYDEKLTDRVRALLKGFVYVGPGETRIRRDLQRWLDRCCVFVSSLAKPRS